MEDRKIRIMYFLERNPFSTAREVADGLKSTRSNYKIIVNIIKKLEEEGKIGNLPEIKTSYFVLPTQPEGPDKLYLAQIMSHEKIFLPRFKKLKIDRISKITNVYQLIKIMICVIHLRLKISLYHKYKEYDKRDQQFYPDFEFFVDVHRNFLRELVNSELKVGDNTFDNNLYFYGEYFKDDLRRLEHEFRGLRSDRIPLEKLIELMTIKEYTGSYKEAAEKHGTTIKNIRKLLKPIADEQGNFSFDKYLKHEEVSIDPRTLDFVPDITLLWKMIEEKKSKTKKEKKAFKIR